MSDTSVSDCVPFLLSWFQDDKEDDMYFTAANTLMQQQYQAGRHGNGTMVEKEVDLNTLIIVDDQDEDAMDTMKSEGEAPALVCDSVYLLQSWKK